MADDDTTPDTTPQDSTVSGGGDDSGAPAVRSSGDGSVGPLSPGWMDPKMLQPTPPATPPEQPDPVMQGFLKREEESRKMLEEEHQREAPFYDAALKAVSAPMPQYPRMQPLPEAPKQEDYTKGAVRFAGGMAVLGALGTAFFHVPAGAALDGFAKAVNGFHQGNLEAYEAGNKEWSQNTQRAIQYNQNLLGQYNAAMAARKGNIDAAMSAVGLIAAQNHDMIAFKLAEDKNYTGIAEYLAKAGRSTDQVQSAFDNMSENDKKGRATLGTLVDNYPTIDSPEFGGWWSSLSDQQQRNVEAAYRMTGSPGGYTPKAINNLAQQWIDTGEMPKGLPRDKEGKAVVGRIMNRAAELMDDQGLTMADVEDRRIKWKADQAARIATAKRQTNIDVAAEELKKFAGPALAASEAVSRGNLVPWNQVRQAVQGASSDPNLKELQSRVQGMITAYAGLIGRGNGAATVHAQQRAQHILSEADGQEAFRRAVLTLIDEANLAQQAPQTILKKMSDDFRRRGQTDAAIEIENAVQTDPNLTAAITPRPITLSGGYSPGGGVQFSTPGATMPGASTPTGDGWGSLTTH